MVVNSFGRSGKRLFDSRAYVPELPAYERAITIRHLIHHTSGLRECVALWAITGRDMMRMTPHQDVLDLLARQRGLNFAPGEEYGYNNSNYFLLALIVERVSKQALGVFMTERIFAPLGMHTSAFHDDSSANDGRRAYGYVSTADEYTRVPEGIGARGAAGVFSTAGDLARWDQNFYQPIVGDKAMIAQLLTPGRLISGRPIHYAFGLFVQNYADLVLVSHAGIFAGFSTQLMRFPEQRFSVICLANNPGITLVFNAIVGFALSWVLHRVGHRLLIVLPNEPKAIYLSTSMRLPVKLTLTQFVWLLEVIVATAVFIAVVGKRLFLVGGVIEVLSGAILFAVGLALYFLPVYLGKLWIKRYYSVLPLLRPTEEVVTSSLPGVRPH